MASCYLVEKRLPGPSNISCDADLMFHGWARRYGAAYPLLEYSYGDKLSHPLKVTKNIFIQAGIWQPNTNWVVSEPVMKLLSAYKAVTFLPVVFEKVFRAQFDLKKDRFKNHDDEERILNKFENDPGLQRDMGSWYEVITPMYAHFESDYDGLGSEFSIDQESKSVPLEIRLASEMFDDQPMFWKRVFFLREDLFKELSKFIDRRFFRFTEIRLG